MLLLINSKQLGNTIYILLVKTLQLIKERATRNFHVLSARILNCLASSFRAAIFPTRMDACCVSHSTSEERYPRMIAVYLKTTIL